MRVILARSPFVLLSLTVCLALTAAGCGTTNTRGITTGMIAGGTVGALAGNSLLYHGKDDEDETRNTIVSAVVGALLAGGALAWHYRELEEAKFAMSAKYSRYRLCDPDELKVDAGLGFNESQDRHIYTLDEKSLRENSIRLDKNTVWIFPSFLKRKLPAESGENRLLSERYIWEISRPGRFINRTQGPEYFETQESDGAK